MAVIVSSDASCDTLNCFVRVEDEQFVVYAESGKFHITRKVKKPVQGESTDTPPKPL